METRELFWGLGADAVRLFYLIGWFAIAVSLGGIGWHVVKYRRGRASPVPVDLWPGVKRAAAALLSHRQLRRRDRYAGVAHAGMFFGFVLLFAGTTIITIDYDIVRPLFHVSFWRGTFFLWFSLVLDLAGIAGLAGLAALFWRRATFALPKLDYARRYRGEAALRPAARRWRVGDWVFLVALCFILGSGFLQEALRHATEQPPWRWWEPVGELLSLALVALHPSPATLLVVRAANWWLHGLAALVFIAALPWYKAKHMLSAIGSLVARDPLTLSRLPRPDSAPASIGVATISDFSWKDLLDFDACTKCGRCHEACPAQTAGLPLSPRDFILDLRVHNESAWSRTVPGIALVDGVISQETIWACRSCGACQEICPVGIEHPVKIVQLRRQLVERRQMEPLLEQTLTAIGNTGNSFGENSRKRSAWTRELPFRVKDIRTEPAPNLWFVGDYASFDPRNQKVSRTFAGLLRAAGVDFGLLHEGERTAGNDVRRVGEEGLYESLAAYNLGQMAAAQPFAHIITTDPHSFNTLRNEYPEFGALPPVRHYTQVLRELLESGRLRVREPLKLRVTFHDPCHLGRLNKRYDDPRRVLELIGCELIEMPRNRSNSFCCGAGGGHIWMADPPGKKKPAQLRVEEAAALGPLDVFVTCCPKDLTMFEDARKTAGVEHAFVVADIAELVARAVQLQTLQAHDVPALIAAISESVVEQVSARVEAQLQSLLGGVVLAQRGGQAPAIGRDLPEPPAPAADSATAPAAGAVVPAARIPWRAVPVQPARFGDYAPLPATGKRLLVAVKHVAKLADEFRIGADEKRVPAEYFDYQLNEFDDVALEQALTTAEALGGAEVVVVTVGPPAAEDTLRKALAKGAQRGVRVWSEALESADPIAIARMLAGVALAEQPQLVFCGVQSSDQANGATGTALARLLGYACAAVVVATRWEGDQTIHLTRELEGGLRHEFRMPVPAVVTMQAGANVPRYATMRMQKQAAAKPIVALDPGAQADAFRAATVEQLAIPSARRATMLSGTPAEIAAQVLALVDEKNGAGT